MKTFKRPPCLGDLLKGEFDVMARSCVDNLERKTVEIRCTIAAFNLQGYIVRTRLKSSCLECPTISSRVDLNVGAVDPALFGNLATQHRRHDSS